MLANVFSHEHDSSCSSEVTTTGKVKGASSTGTAANISSIHSDSASQGASLPKPKHGCPAEATLRRDVPVVKCSYGTDYIPYNFGRISHGTKPGAGLPRAGWNDLGNRFAEFRDTHRRTRLSYFFEYSQARCFEFGDSNFPHIQFVPSSKTMARMSLGESDAAGPRDQREMSTHGSSHESSKMELSPPPS